MSKTAHGQGSSLLESPLAGSFGAFFSPARVLWCGALTAVVLQLAYAAGASERHLYAVFRDDAFYYFTVARNLVETGQSTFDGTYPTNGYHPLWLALLLPLTALFADAERGFLLSVLALGAISAVLTTGLLLRLGRRLFAHEPRHEGLLAVSVCGALVLALPLLFIGMETTLAVPALLFAAERLLDLLGRERHASSTYLGFGLVLAGLTLSRLDAMLFCAAAVAGVLWTRRRDRAECVRFVLFTGLGASPVAAYFAFNALTYGHLLTVSARAKGLSNPSGINTLALSALTTKVVAPIVGLAIAGGVSVGFRNLWASPRARVVAAALSSAALLHMSMILLRSTWYIWRWYLYLLIPCVMFGVWAGLHLLRAHVRGPALAVLVLLAAITLPASVWAGNRRSQTSMETTIFDWATQLAEYERDHPGRYAMGPGAGMAGYRMRRAPVQLEGLMSDHRLLEHIRGESDLKQVMRLYEVDFLIDKGPYELEHNGCRRLEFPHPGQSGDGSPKMRTEFCTEPIELGPTLHLFTASMF